MTATDITTIRAKRFEDVLAGYESRDRAHDPTVQGAAKDVARYAVVTESNRGFGYSVTYAETMADAETVGGADISTEWWPVCVYDLDVLVGEEPILSDGDIVRYNGEERTVSHHDYEAADGEPYPVIYLESKDDDDPWEGPLDPANEDIELVERAMPDERMPARYKLAGIRTVVMFNTSPEPPA